MSRIPISPRRANQRGFALLVIFLMAAGVALMLFRQMPRVAFERERDKEQLLMDRGKQFIRAITLYTREQNAYPQSLEDLEKKNNKRYLRKRYIDPYTGKNEWRIIHTNGTALTDSLVEAPPDVNSSSSQSTTNTTDQGPQVNMAATQRPSDLTLPGQTPSQAGVPPLANAPAGVVPPGVVPQFPGQPTFPGGSQAGGAGQLGQNPQQPGEPNQPTFQPQFPGQQFAGQQFPGQPPPAGMRIENGQLVPSNLPPGAQPQINPQFANQLPGQTFPGQPGNVQTKGGAQSAAVNLINQLLTTPRQAPAGIAPANNTITGGIAGVASTHTGPSIKVYNERQKYQEWEFVFKGQVGGGGGGGGGTPTSPSDPSRQSGTDGRSSGTTTGPSRQGTGPGTFPTTVPGPFPVSPGGPGATGTFGGGGGKGR